MDTKSPVVVHVTHRFHAPTEHVFDAWVDPRTIRLWMFGVTLPDEVLHLNVEARVGGTFSFLIRREGREIDHVGEYLEVDRPRRLAFTWGVRGDETGSPSRVVLDLRPLDKGSELTLTHHLPPESAEQAARTEAGWKKMIAALDEVLGR
jgi:uncharacterized protein YndB with AHSA1/START domain